MTSEFIKKLGLNQKSPKEICLISPLVLAYIGDAVYEVFIRTYILYKYKGVVNDLHKIATRFVKASGQAQIIHELETEWSEEEWRIIKRGRNQRSSSVPKNADLVDYKYATGFETLIGYLYLMENTQRLEEIMKMAIEVIEQSQAKLKR